MTIGILFKPGEAPLTSESAWIGDNEPGTYCLTSQGCWYLVVVNPYVKEGKNWKKADDKEVPKELLVQALLLK